MATGIVFAKEPEPGKVKTRLTPPFTPAEAVELYTAFVEDVCATVAAVAERRVLAAPGGPGPMLAAIAERHGFELAIQQGPDLGARMKHALGAELAHGADAVILVGSDSPTLPAAALREAIAVLGATKNHAVIGPAGDGGYWLVGASGRVPDLFDGIAWSTRDVLSATLARAEATRTGLSLLPFWYDVDEVSDVRLLDAHLGWLGKDVAPRTSAALAALKVRRADVFRGERAN